METSLVHVLGQLLEFSHAVYPLSTSESLVATPYVRLRGAASVVEPELVDVASVMEVASAVGGVQWCL